MKALTLRLDDDLYARLTTAAKREHRDITHQIRTMLEEGLDHRALTDPETIKAITPEEVGALISRALDREYRRQ